MKLLIALSAILALGVATRYDNFRLIAVDPGSQAGLEILQKIYEIDESMFWDKPMRWDIPLEMLVNPIRYGFVVDTLRKYEIRMDVRMQNYQAWVDADVARITSRGAYDPNDYNTYADIISEINRMADACVTGFTCNTYSLGESTQGRDLRVLSITKSGSGRQSVWFDSLIHAREWLAGATMMNIVNKLMTEYGSNTDATHILDNYDIYFLPVHNPDGFEFSFSSRLWRKSRNNNPGSPCIGTDLNRNWEARWGTGGSSGSPCSDVYMGSSPASEPEVKLILDELKRISDLSFYFSVHSFGQYMLFPWAAPDDSGNCFRTPDHADQMSVANAGADAAEAAGNIGSWARGTACETIYAASGGSFDSAYQIAGIKYAYTPELRGGSFSPPASAIAPSVNEIWAALVAMFGRMEEIEGRRR